VATRGIIREGVATAAVTMAGVVAVGVLEALLREEGITFVFARLKGPMRQALRNAGVLDLVGEHHDYPTVRAAVAAALAGTAQPVGRAGTPRACPWLPNHCRGRCGPGRRGGRVPRQRAGGQGVGRKLNRLLHGFLEGEVLPQAERAADLGLDPTPLLAVVSDVLRLYADALERPDAAGS
jgi:hypothetical protein